jgi:hypothetical protein
MVLCIALHRRLYLRTISIALSKNGCPGLAAEEEETEEEL